MLLPQSYNPFLWNRGGSPFGGRGQDEQESTKLNPLDFVQKSQPEQDPMMSKYQQFLNEGPPKRSENKPSLLEKLASVVTGGSSLDRKYNRALEDRQIKGKELSTGAKLEYDIKDDAAKRALDERRVGAFEKNAESNADNRGSLVTSRARRLDLAEKIADGKATDEEKQEYEMSRIAARGKNIQDNTAAQGDNRIRNTQEQGNQNRLTEGTRQTGRVALENARQTNRQKILDFKKNNPTFRIVAGKGGNYFAINPEDPTDVADTGVATGTMTEQDKAELGLIDTKTTTELNPEGTKRTTNTTRTRQTKTPDSSPRTTPETKPKQMLAPDGKRYDTSTWSDADIAEAKKRGYK